MFYVYLYRDTAGTPIYVGKGRGRRAWSHRSSSHNPELKKLVVAQDLQPEILDRFKDEAMAFAREIDLIAYFGRSKNGTGTLLNVTSGGNGWGGGTPSQELTLRAAVLLNDVQFMQSCLDRRQQLGRETRSIKKQRGEDTKKAAREFLRENKVVVADPARTPVLAQPKKHRSRGRRLNRRKLRPMPAQPIECFT
jgi:hypothetical protein